MLQVVLAQKSPAWLQVIHERLKHLIISSETFWNKRKMEYGAKREIKLYEKTRLLGNKRQKLLQFRNYPTIGQKTNQLKTALYVL